MRIDRSPYLEPVVGSRHVMAMQCGEKVEVLVKIEEQIPLLEEIFSEWRSTLGVEYEGYRNHVYRMIHFCLALRDCDEEEREKIVIAGTFHDMGIWIEDTLDYLPPSVLPAREYLKRRSLETWSDEIERMIVEHHKIRPYADQSMPLVELFRKGDLVDFSLGLFRFGIEKTYIDAVKAKFPNSGFHKGLAKRAARWFVKHPLNPAPMMKW